jgi:hypothetical protein
MPTNDNFIEVGNEQTAKAASTLQKELGEDTLFVLVALFPAPDKKAWYPQVARNISKKDLQHALTFLNEYIASLPE